MEKRIEIINKLKEILQNYVEIEDGAIKEEMNLTTDIGLDSFALICMVGDVESAFNIKIETTVLSKIHTLGEMVDFILEKTK